MLMQKNSKNDCVRCMSRTRQICCGRCLYRLGDRFLLRHVDPLLGNVFIQANIQQLLLSNGFAKKKERKKGNRYIGEWRIPPFLTQSVG
jgi:hypothetical protein